VLTVAVAEVGVGATAPLGRIASSLAGAAGAAALAAGVAVAGVWACAAADAKVLANTSSNIFFITWIRRRIGKIASVKLSNSEAASAKFAALAIGRAYKFPAFSKLYLRLACTRRK
jgi:hypothetical protein